jgi:hypothetical protein
MTGYPCPCSGVFCWDKMQYFGKNEHGHSHGFGYSCLGTGRFDPPVLENLTSTFPSSVIFPVDIRARQAASDLMYP